MKIFKRNNYFIAFNKNEAINILQELKQIEKICVIDFESFQIPRWARSKYPNIKINDVPFCVGLGILKFDKETSSWIVENKQVYSFDANQMNEKTLLKNILELGAQIDYYLGENNVDKLLALAVENELRALSFMNKHAVFEWIQYLLEQEIKDIYDYFNNLNNFKMIHYDYKFRYYANRFMINEVNDQISNKDIGEKVSKHFLNRAFFKDWELVREHNINDLEKAAWMLNDLEYLVNIDEEEFLK